MNEPIERGSAPPAHVTVAATTQVVPSADRALASLIACVDVAETGLWIEPPVAAIVDYRAVELPMLRLALERVLMSRNPDSGLDALLAAGALDALLPEIKAMVGFGDGEFRHKDVWRHTKQVVRQAASRTEVRWAALLHDIGKLKTRRISPDGEVHFFGHAEVGASMFDRMQRRLPLFTGVDRLSTSIRFLILHHLRASQYDKGWTDSAVRRFAKDMGPLLGDLLDLSRADITTKSAERKRRGLDSITKLSERVRAIEDMDARTPPLPKGLGTAISERFGIAPSPRLGDLMKVLRAAVDGGTLDALREPDYYLAYLVAQGLVSAKR